MIFIMLLTIHSIDKALLSPPRHLSRADIQQLVFLLSCKAFRPPLPSLSRVLSTPCGFPRRHPSKPRCCQSFSIPLSITHPLFFYFFFLFSFRLLLCLQALSALRSFMFLYYKQLSDIIIYLRIISSKSSTKYFHNLLL